ncbi:hypothetical protein F4819DRAFT_445073 [Hypoxylon fuscum]|nr:hypothetical protein F4819DRAFT_445073 [Hypoxylon fuscum]
MLSRMTLNTVPDMQEVQTGPLRILVQTKTHLVPGDEYSERCKNMKNLICQHYWDRDFDYNRDRFYAYRADFAYEGRRCYFLLDHGHSDTDDVPLLWYKWTGNTFIAIEHPLPIQLRAKLKHYPFIKPQTQHRPEKSSAVDDATRRQMIRSRLRSNMPIPKVEVELLKNPEQVRLLKDSVDPRFWQKIDALLTAQQAEG